MDTSGDGRIDHVWLDADGDGEIDTLEIDRDLDGYSDIRYTDTDGDDIVTTSETPDNPSVSRMVYSQRPDSGTMIGQELQRFGPDEFYEEAVRWVVHLIPE